MQKTPIRKRFMHLSVGRISKCIVLFDAICIENAMQLCFAHDNYSIFTSRPRVRAFSKIQPNSAIANTK